MKLLCSFILAASSRDTRRDEFTVDKEYVDAVCAEKGEGSYAYSDSVCDHYIHCEKPGSQAVPHVMPCSPGTVWNSVEGFCDHPFNTPPPCGTLESGEPTHQDCEQGDGVYAHHHNCEEYFICYMGQKYFGKCPAGFGFDQVGKMCSDDLFVTSFYCNPTKKVYGNPVTTQAMAFCDEKEDGYYVNPGVCGRFIKCWSQIGSEFTCESAQQNLNETLVWNSSEQTCDHPATLADQTRSCLSQADSIELEELLDPMEICKNNGPGMYAIEGVCEKYVQCYNSSWMGERGGRVKKCSTGLVFDGETKVCDFAENVAGVCHNNKPAYDVGEKPNVPEENEILEDQWIADADKFCEEKGEGTHRSDNDCSVFYVCQSHGRSDKFHCPDGLYFNEQGGYCDWGDNLADFDTCFSRNLYMSN